jgi:F-box and WD-40 domain protein CDC4
LLGSANSTSKPSSPSAPSSPRKRKSHRAHTRSRTSKAGPGNRSDVCNASQGWGQPNTLVVSGGCDKVLRVWDVRSGYVNFSLVLSSEPG